MHKTILGLCIKGYIMHRIIHGLCMKGQTVHVSILKYETSGHA